MHFVVAASALGLLSLGAYQLRAELTASYVELTGAPTSLWENEYTPVAIQPIIKVVLWMLILACSLFVIFQALA